MTAPRTHNLVAALGATLRAERVRLGLTQAQVASRAHMPRQKLIQIEQGKPGVAVVAYAAVMDAMALAPAVKPAQLVIAEFAQLHRLAWNRGGTDTISEQDALALYERHWDMVDADRMTPAERALLERLVAKHGNGHLHV